MEVSFEQTGKLLGVEVTDVATYEATMEPDGHLEGHCEGIGMTKVVFEYDVDDAGNSQGRVFEWK
jgi:hypothetical protein